MRVREREKEGERDGGGESVRAVNVGRESERARLKGRAGETE